MYIILWWAREGKFLTAIKNYNYEYCNYDGSIMVFKTKREAKRYVECSMYRDDLYVVKVVLKK